MKLWYIGIICNYIPPHGKHWNLNGVDFRVPVTIRTVTFNAHLEEVVEVSTIATFMDHFTRFMDRKC